MFNLTGEEATLPQISGTVQYFLTRLQPPLQGERVLRRGVLSPADVDLGEHAQRRRSEGVGGPGPDRPPESDLDRLPMPALELLPRERYTEFSYGADLLFHDAEYTPEEYESKVLWGHSAYTEAVDLALEAGVKTLGLFHHSQERDDDTIDKIVEDCRKRIAESGKTMDCFAVAADMYFEL